MLVGEVINTLKKNNFHNLGGLNKKELEELYIAFSKSNEVPFIHQSIKKGQPCVNDLQCTTKNCVDNKCGKRHPKDPSKKLANDAAKAIEGKKQEAVKVQMGDIILILKKAGFHNLSGLNKKNILDLYVNYEKTNDVPYEHQRIKVGRPCVDDKQCTTKICKDNVCQGQLARKHDLKPLEVKKYTPRNTLETTVNNCKKYDDIVLKPYQEKVIDFFLKSKDKGLIIFHAVGSGKSVTALATSKCLLAKFPDKCVIILTPSSVIQQFKQELIRMKIPDEISKRINIYTHQTWLDRYKTKQVNSLDSILIIDEAHKFKNFKEDKPRRSEKKVLSTYSDYMASAAKEAFKVILLTATPLENKTEEVINYLRMTTTDDTKTITKNHQDPDYLKCKFSFFKNLSGNEFYPEVREKFINLEPGRDYKLKYDEVTKNIRVGKFINLDKDTGDLASFYNGLRRAVNLIDSPSPKIKWTVNKIKLDLKKNKKSLIYSTWLKFGVELLETELEKHNIEYRTIQGSINIKKRKQYIEDYNSGKIKVLLITSAGAEGLDLKNTRNVFILEPFWHHSRIEQVIGRAVRYQSHQALPLNERNVTIYKLVLKDTLDEKLYKMSKDKLVSISAYYKMIQEQSIEKNKCY